MHHHSLLSQLGYQSFNPVTLPLADSITIPASTTVSTPLNTLCITSSRLLFFHRQGCHPHTAGEIQCPDPPAQKSSEVYVNVQGKLESLKKVIERGGSVEVKTLTKNLIAEYPNADKVFLQYALIQLTCEMIKNSNLPEDKKFEQLNRLRLDILSVLGNISHRIRKDSDALAIERVNGQNARIAYVGFVRATKYRNCELRQDGTVAMSDLQYFPWIAAQIPFVKRTDRDPVSNLLVEVNVKDIFAYGKEYRKFLEYMLIKSGACVNLDWFIVIEVIPQVTFLPPSYYTLSATDQGIGQDFGEPVVVSTIEESDGRKYFDRYKAYRDPCGQPPQLLFLVQRFLGPEGTKFDCQVHYMPPPTIIVRPEK
jgi:hypothetical protein